MTPRALGELAALVGGEVIGNAALHVSGVAGLAEATAGELSFYANPRYQAELGRTKASAVLVARGSELPSRAGVAWVRVSQPHLAFARIAQVFHPETKHMPGVDPKADVHPNAEVDPSATVMAFASVAGGARIGPRAVLYPGVYVGRNARVGRASVLHANVVVREECQVGRRCILHAGVVVGADGFGFAFDAAGPAHVKIPQVGTVRIEDDVEIGANTCIDRATSGETLIGRGSKIDNLVQVAHNVEVGPLSILCAQAGVSGSTELGAGVVLAGQVGVVGHLKIGDGAIVGPQSGVGRDLEPGARVTGSPAVPHGEWLRSVAALPQLGELVKEVRALRRRVSELEKERDSANDAARSKES